jgi:hypothetical protein
MTAVIAVVAGALLFATFGVAARASRRGDVTSCARSPGDATCAACPNRQDCEYD